MEHFELLLKKLRLTINRDTISAQFYALFREPSFSVLIDLRVTFSGEEGTDCSALKTDCLRLLLNELKNDLSLFEGTNYAKLLGLNMHNLADGRYKFVGQVLQIAILNKILSFSVPFYIKWYRKNVQISLTTSIMWRMVQWKMLFRSLKKEEMPSPVMKLSMSTLSTPAFSGQAWNYVSSQPLLTRTEEAFLQVAFHLLFVSKS